MNNNNGNNTWPPDTLAESSLATDALAAELTTNLANGDAEITFHQPPTPVDFTELTGDD